MKKKYPKKNPVQAGFWERVRKFRKAKGWSQEELADACALHRTYIGGIERGERNVSLRNIRRIADTLRVGVGKLFEEA